MRLGKSQFRAQATFSTSLGLSEFLALITPFILHLAATQYRNSVGRLAICALPVMIATAVLSQARTGIVGIVIALLLYPAVRIFLHRRSNPHSLVGASALYLSPLAGALALAILYFVPGFHKRIFGGGAEQYSNQSRWDQVHMGIPKILAQPWGHGIGQGAETLGYTNAAGMLTIDSYPLRLALEYGFVGLALYAAVFAVGIGYAARSAIRARDEKTDEYFFAAIAIALFSSVVMKVVFAQEDNQPIVFIFMGMLTGLRFRAFQAKMAGRSTFEGAVQ